LITLFAAGPISTLVREHTLPVLVRRFVLVLVVVLVLESGHAE